MLLLLACLLWQPSPAKPDYHLVTLPAQRIAATLKVKIEAPNLNTAEWILFAARAPELEYQTQASTGLLPLGTPIRDLSDLKRPMLVARVPVGNATQRQELEVKLTIQATLHSRQLREGIPAPRGSMPRLSDEAQRRALGSNTLVDYKNPEFQAWLQEQKLKRASGESDLDFARRTFVFLQEYCGYEYKDHQERRASVICKSGKSDCGGLSALFVATLRASGVPARALIGRWANSARSNGKLEGLPYSQTHVKAEFFAEGIGWVPVDLSQAVSDKANREKGLTFFGRDPGDFLVLHIDHDLKVDSYHFGIKTIDGLQGVNYYAPGPGNFDGCKCSETWEVRIVK